MQHAALVVAQADGEQVAHYRNKEVKGLSVRGRSAVWETVDDFGLGSGPMRIALVDLRDVTDALAGGPDVRR